MSGKIPGDAADPGTTLRTSALRLNNADAPGAQFSYWRDFVLPWVLGRMVRDYVLLEG